MTGADCCGEDDCFPVTPDSYRRFGNEYRIRIGPLVYRYPANEVLPTEDPRGIAWACVSYPDHKARCFFIPTGS